MLLDSQPFAHPGENHSPKARNDSMGTAVTAARKMPSAVVRDMTQAILGFHSVRSTDSILSEQPDSAARADVHVGQRRLGRMILMSWPAIAPAVRTA